MRTMKGWADRHPKEEVIYIDSSMKDIVYATDLDQKGIVILQKMDDGIAYIGLKKRDIPTVIQELQDAYEAFLELRR